MGTITFKVHSITPTSPRNMLATIFKSILILFVFNIVCIFFFFWAYLAWAYKREKKYPIMLSFKHHNFAMPKHADVIHDWWALVVIWLFSHSLWIFSSFLSKRVIWVLSKKDYLIALITNTSHKAHLLSCAMRCSSKLQMIQSLENFVSIAIQGTQVPCTQNTRCFCIFLCLIFFLWKQNKAKT